MMRTVTYLALVALVMAGVVSAYAGQPEAPPKKQDTNVCAEGTICTPSPSAVEDTEDEPAVGIQVEKKLTIIERPSEDSSDDKASQEFQVNTVNTLNKSKIHPPPNRIHLITPPHKSTMTPGVVTFAWELPKKAKRKDIRLIIEKIDDKKTKNSNWKASKDTKKRIYVGPGKYRWRVADSSSKFESLWRLFTVIKLKGRDLTSIPPINNPVSNSPQVTLSPNPLAHPATTSPARTAAPAKH